MSKVSESIHSLFRAFRRNKDVIEAIALTSPKVCEVLDRLKNIEDTWDTLRSDVAALKVDPAVQRVMSDVDSLGIQLASLRDALK